MSDISRTKRENEHILESTVPSPGVVGGAMCMVEDTIGIWQEAYDTGVTGILIIESEMILLPKAAGAITKGDYLYYDSAAFTVTNVSGSGLFRCGVAREDAANAAATVESDFWGHDAVLIP